MANVIRLIGAPYALVMVAAGQHRYVKVSPLSEGIANFIASIALGYVFGAVGVAWGTLVGSVVGVASHLMYSMPRTHPVIKFSRVHLVVTGVLWPLLCTSPLVGFAVAAWRGVKLSVIELIAAVLLSNAAAGLLVLRSKHSGTNDRAARTATVHEPS